MSLQFEVVIDFPKRSYLKSIVYIYNVFKTRKCGMFLYIKDTTKVVSFTKVSKKKPIAKICSSSNGHLRQAPYNSMLKFSHEINMFAASS